MKPFTDDLEDNLKGAVNRLRKIILEADPAVEEEVGKIMSADRSFIYNQDGVFKYGLAKTSVHYTFHSIVMYAYPDVAQFIKKNSDGLNIQKGCFNFQSPDKLSPELFEQIMNKSAEKDFTPVIERYKKR